MADFKSEVAKSLSGFALTLPASAAANLKLAYCGGCAIWTVFILRSKWEHFIDVIAIAVQ